MNSRVDDHVLDKMLLFRGKRYEGTSHLVGDFVPTHKTKAYKRVNNSKSAQEENEKQVSRAAAAPSVQMATYAITSDCKSEAVKTHQEEEEVT